MLHARYRAALADRMRSVGKRALDESGKHRVNKVSEENYLRVNTKAPRCVEQPTFDLCRGAPHVIASASEAIHRMA